MRRPEYEPGANAVYCREKQQPTGEADAMDKDTSDDYANEKKAKGHSIDFDSGPGIRPKQPRSARLAIVDAIKKISDAPKETADRRSHRGLNFYEPRLNNEFSLLQFINQRLWHFVVESQKCVRRRTFTGPRQFHARDIDVVLAQKCP